MIKMNTTFLLLVIFTVFIIKIHSIEQLENNFYISAKQNVYFIEPEAKYTWYQALIKCTNMDMSLVTIDTKEKSDDLNTLLQNNFKNIIPLWVGAVLDSEKPRSYAWISTGQSLSYTNWADGQPDFTGHREYCIQAAAEDDRKSIKWSDEKCFRTFGFVCERSRYSYLQEQMEKRLQEDVEKQQQLQNELDKNKLFIRFLMDYRRPQVIDGENNTVRDIILNIN